MTEISVEKESSALHDGCGESIIEHLVNEMSEIGRCSSSDENECTNALKVVLSFDMPKPSTHESDLVEPTWGSANNISLLEGDTKERKKTLLHELAHNRLLSATASKEKEHEPDSDDCLGMDFSKEKKCHLDSNSENKIGIKEREALPMTKLSEESVVIQSSKITNTVRNVDRGDKDMLKHLCDRAGEWKKNGGRHTCCERGCPLSSSRINAQISDNWDSHLCQLGCSEKWRCGQHSCQPLCYSGHCLPCLETIFSDLSCVWGKTVILPPLPYGNPPPSCQQLCSVPQPYGHLAIHSCHFGDWPPCLVPVAKECIGRYVVLRNVLCVSKDIRYNQLCGKTRQCGMLACARTCQPLPCDSASGASSGSKVSCGQVCGASRRDCRHACTATSHPYYPCLDIRCEISVPITCSCGRITANVPYDAGMNLLKHILLKHVLLGCIIINHALLKHVLDKFVEIGRGSMEYNVNEFEDAMLKETAFNYSRKAYNWILEDSCPDHMLQVENCLTQEKDRVAHSLHSSIEHKLRGKVQDELLSTYASQLPEQEHSGCHVLLRDDKVGDLSGVKQAENAARAKKVEKLDVVGLQEQIFVRKVINLCDKYLAYVNDCYTNPSFFFTRLLRKLSKFSAIRVSLETAVLSFSLLLVTIFFSKEVEATNKSLAEVCSERPPPTLLLYIHGTTRSPEVDGLLRNRDQLLRELKDKLIFCHSCCSYSKLLPIVLLE